MKDYKRITGLIVAILLVTAVMAVPVNGQSGTQRFARIITRTLVVENAATFQDTVTVTGDLTVSGAVTQAGTLDLNGEAMVLDADADSTLTADTDDQLDLALNGSDVLSVTATTLGLGALGIDQDTNTENIGLPTILSVPITYTAAAGGSGTVATIGDGEIWLVHKVLVNVTTDFDATGDDVTLDIGDGGDADGLIDLADADLQAADTEGTGFAAGWQGQSAGTIGAYLDGNENGFIYAPSGSAETIDWLLDETSGETITAGEATIYVIYTRIQ